MAADAVCGGYINIVSTSTTTSTVHHSPTILQQEQKHTNVRMLLLMAFLVKLV